MAKFLGKFILVLLLVLPSTVLFVGQGGSGGLLVRAEAEGGAGDAVEGEDDEATVETDEGPTPAADTTEPEGAVTETEGEEEEEEDEKALKPSPDADTYILFTKPSGTSDLPAGGLVRLLVGFTNNGDTDFTVETMDAAFRYPQDYSFYIQNFTVVKYNHIVEPKRQATFEYVFSPSETFHSRPFGLTVNLNYKDSDGNLFQNAVFNETVNVVETEEGLDGETFFLYIFLAAVTVLLLVGAHQVLTQFGKKRLIKTKAPVEMGTQNADVDYDWLPKETVEFNKSPRRSPKQSPRQRRSKRQQGSAED